MRDRECYRRRTGKCRLMKSTVEANDYKHQRRERRCWRWRHHCIGIRRRAEPAVVVRFDAVRLRRRGRHRQLPPDRWRARGGRRPMASQAPSSHSAITPTSKGPPRIRRRHEPTWGRHKLALVRRQATTTTGPTAAVPTSNISARPLDRTNGAIQLRPGLAHHRRILAAAARTVKWRARTLPPTRPCVLAYCTPPFTARVLKPPTRRCASAGRSSTKPGADVVLNGHDHIYERFAPQDDKGKADAKHGIREFIAGTGGGGVYKIGRLLPTARCATTTRMAS